MLSTGCTKVSILLFYRRVLWRSYSVVFHRTNLLLLFSVIATTIACYFSLVFSCTPVEAYWKNRTFIEPLEPTPTDYKCRGEPVTMLIPSIISVITDFLVTIFPLFFISRLQLPPRQKWVLMFIFALGFLYANLPEPTSKESWQTRCMADVDTQSLRCRHHTHRLLRDSILSHLRSTL